MTNKEIEQRLAALETEFALLKSKMEKNGEVKTPWYEKIAGTFADDPAYDEAMRLGREYRLSQREDYDKDED